MSENVIYSINGPVVKVKNAKDFSMLEMVYVGHAKLMGEVISISKDLTTIQVYETTTGLKPGEPVISTGSPICVTLGPGILRISLMGLNVLYKPLLNNQVLLLKPEAMLIHLMLKNYGTLQ